MWNSDNIPGHLDLEDNERLAWDLSASSLFRWVILSFWNILKYFKILKVVSEMLAEKYTQKQT